MCVRHLLLLAMCGILNNRSLGYNEAPHSCMSVWAVLVLCLMVCVMVWNNACFTMKASQVQQRGGYALIAKATPDGCLSHIRLLGRKPPMVTRSSAW